MRLSLLNPVFASDPYQKTSSMRQLWYWYWFGMFAVWLVVTRDYHPTWILRIACTAILVGGSAVFALVLMPRKPALRHVLLSLVGLLVTGPVTASSIHLIYDAAIGPDPRRFTFVSNVVLDTGFVLLNSLIAAVAGWLGKAKLAKSHSSAKLVK